MKKRNIILTGILIISIMILTTGCSGMSTMEKFDTASEKLAAAGSYTMDITMDIKSSGTGDSTDSDEFSMEIPGTKVLVKSEIPDPNEPATMKMSTSMNMNVMGESVEFEYYMKENVLYIGMQSIMEGYLYIDMDLPEAEEVAGQAMSFSTDTFMLESITEENITVTEETIRYMGEDTTVDCLQVTITEENFMELIGLLSASSEQITGSDAETDEEKFVELMEMMDIEDIVYKLYINEDIEIIRFDMSYSMTMSVGEASLLMSIDMRADIFDVNSTIVEYPDLSDAIDYMGLLQFGIE